MRASAVAPLSATPSSDDAGRSACRSVTSACLRVMSMVVKRTALEARRFGGNDEDGRRPVGEAPNEVGRRTRTRSALCPSITNELVPESS